MKFEIGTEGRKYDYFSANGQMVRELKRAIKEKKRLELALELLAAVNRSARERAEYKIPDVAFADSGSKAAAIDLPVGHTDRTHIGGELRERRVIWCPKHSRKEFRYKTI